MVLPLVILAVLTVIWLLTLFFSQTAVRSGVHLALRSGAGICTDTVLRPEDEGFSGLYDNLLRASETEELLEEQGRRYISAAGLKQQAELEGVYSQSALVSVLKLNFQRSYGGRGLFHGRIEGDGSCWYFNIDEAQWIRNEDWLHNAVKGS